jgi:hypothetical protein
VTGLKVGEKRNRTVPPEESYGKPIPAFLSCLCHVGGERRGGIIGQGHVSNMPDLGRLGGELQS